MKLNKTTNLKFWLIASVVLLPTACTKAWSPRRNQNPASKLMSVLASLNIDETTTTTTSNNATKTKTFSSSSSSSSSSSAAAVESTSPTMAKTEPLEQSTETSPSSPVGDEPGAKDVDVPTRQETQSVAAEEPSAPVEPNTENNQQSSAMQTSNESNQQLETSQQQNTPAIVISKPVVASVMGATVITFCLNNYADLGPIRAASLVGLYSSLLFSDQSLSTAALCGAFAGMASTAAIPGVAASVLLGMICAGMLVLFDHHQWLMGMGGRLGWIAQLACTTHFLLASPFVSTASTAAAGESAAAAAALWGSPAADLRTLVQQLPVVSGLTLLGAIVMRLWKYLMTTVATKNFNTNIEQRLGNSVAAVGVTGLLASFVLPQSLSVLAGPILCGSFVAMSAPTHLANTLWSLGAASLLAGAAQLSLTGVLVGGWGGKLGTAALGGVLAYTHIHRAIMASKTTGNNNKNNKNGDALLAEETMRELQDEQMAPNLPIQQEPQPQQ